MLGADQNPLARIPFARIPEGARVAAAVPLV